MFPAKQPSKVVITTNDGREFSEYLEYPKGDPREPMTMNDLENKFNSLAGDKFDDAAKSKIKDNIFNCESKTTNEFMESLNV
jgi:2-methylcitrate dehydratase